MKILSALLVVCLGWACVTAFSGCSKQNEAGVDIAKARQDLKSAETDTKVAACTELAKAGPGAASALPDLLQALKDKDPLVRRLSAYAIGQIGPKAASAAPSLREALADADPEVASDALIALRSLGDTNANLVVPNVMSAPPEPQQ